MKRLNQYWNSFSFVGLVFATLFFALSVSPSLLPRPYFFQGILSGIAIAVGYSLGVAFQWLYHFLELPVPNERVQKILKFIVAIAVALFFVYCLRQMTFWQNSIRQLMEMPMAETAYPWRTAAIALLFGAILIGATRLVVRVCAWLANWLDRLLPRRVAIVISTLVVGFLLVLIGNGIVFRGLLQIADSIFLHADGLVDEGIEQPTDSNATGSSESLIDWASIGRRGKNFIAGGPTRQQISDFLGREAMQPIRVYSGMRSAETPIERAQLALKELQRVNAFERSLLVVATPTGTGWLDPGAVDTLEYLHGGDTAIVCEQYSYLPSWITIMVDPRRSIESADALFTTVYGYWRTLPRDQRPMLYLHGLSLGALGGEVSADLMTTFEDPIQGALWSGPPFPSTQWRRLVDSRNPESPEWLPKIRDGRMIRFTAQENATEPDRPWGPVRIVYIQYASDPMVFFSKSLLYRKPDWQTGQRGPDVSPFLTWYPIVTFLRIAFDLPMATSIPHGYGHNYAPAHYIDGWIAVTDPVDMAQEKVAALKTLFQTNDN